VSLADPDARPIRKGKPQRPTEFGSTVLVGECERGFIAVCHTHKGNPGDAAQLVPAVTEVIALTGRPPGTVVGDQLRMRLNRRVRSTAARGLAGRALAGHTDPLDAESGQGDVVGGGAEPAWRVGIEARISHLKRSFGLRRTRLRRLAGATTWAGQGIFAYNLQRMTVITG
jgi:IS5 family transposase